MKLLLSQKNELYRYIEQHNFDTNQFQYKELRDTKTKKPFVKIEYKPDENFYFLIADSDYDPYLINYSPGASEYLVVTSIDRWHYIDSDFNTWLYALAREVSQIDLWDQIMENAKQVISNISNDNNKFNDDEYKLLALNMRQLQTRVTTLALPIGQIEIINAKLDSILEQARISNKFDWQSLFIGTIITITISLTLSPDIGKELFLWIKQIFSNILLLS